MVARSKGQADESEHLPRLVDAAFFVAGLEFVDSHRVVNGLGYVGRRYAPPIWILAKPITDSYESSCIRRNRSAQRSSRYRRSIGFLVRVIEPWKALYTRHLEASRDQGAQSAGS